MTTAEHSHRWGAWKYGGYSTDMRTCECGGCTGADYRPHRHEWKETEDPFAPVGNAIKMLVCGGPSGCGETKGAGA